LFIIYEDTVATCSASRAGLLSHAKPIQARLSGDSTQIPIQVSPPATKASVGYRGTELG